MQKGKSLNFTKDNKFVTGSNQTEQEEKTLRVLSEIICNIIIQEISKYEKDESFHVDTT